MADFTAFKINVGDLDYPSKVNTWQKVTEDALSEVESAREGEANLLTRVQGLTHNTMVANLNGQSSYYAINFTDPTSPLQLANKQYVDAAVSAGGDPFDILITTLNPGTASARQFLKISTANSNQPVGKLADITIVTSSTYTTAEGEILGLDTAANSITVTLPNSPTVQDAQVSFVDINSSFATNYLTVARNGHLIMGLAEDMTVQDAHVHFRLIFTNNSYGWRIDE